MKFRVTVSKARKTILDRRNQERLGEKLLVIYGESACARVRPCERRISIANREPIFKPNLIIGFRVRLAGDTADMREAHSSVYIF